MFLCLVLQIFHNVFADTRAIHPIEQTPRAEIAPAAARIVRRGTTRNAAHENAGDYTVPRHGHGLLHRGEQGEQEVRQEMWTYHERGEVDG